MVSFLVKSKEIYTSSTSFFLKNLPISVYNRKCLVITILPRLPGSRLWYHSLVRRVGGVDLPLPHPVGRGGCGERLLRLGDLQLFVSPAISTAQQEPDIYTASTNLIGLALGTASRRSLWTSSSSSLFFLISSSLLAPSISASLCFSLRSNFILSSARLSEWRLKLDTSLSGFSDGFGSKGALLRTYED